MNDETIARASGPDNRSTASPPCPGGVEIAAMVSEGDIKKAEKLKLGKCDSRAAATEFGHRA
jgi:hypothetical protein